jgi:hypothetical protein
MSNVPPFWTNFCFLVCLIIFEFSWATVFSIGLELTFKALRRLVDRVWIGKREWLRQAFTESNFANPHTLWDMWWMRIHYFDYVNGETSWSSWQECDNFKKQLPRDDLHNWAIMDWGQNIFPRATPRFLQALVPNCYNINSLFRLNDQKYHFDPIHNPNFFLSNHLSGM